MRVRWGVLGAAALVVSSLGVVPARSADPPPPTQLVLSPEGNNLWAYDAGTNEAQLVVGAVNGTVPDGMTPNSAQRRDINGQICVAPDGTHIVTGEDTVVDGSSHDASIAGWGWFEAKYREGRLSLVQTGKLAPGDALGPGYAGDPDNYGCGFLDGDRLVTTAIGNTLPGEDATGQLFLWFAPFDKGPVARCEIDRTLATAGGIAVDDDGSVYVATNRFDDAQNPGGVWRFDGPWPRSPKECATAKVTKRLVIPNRPTALPVVPDGRAVTPSSVVISPDDTLYVSSVFTGTVSEFTKGGRWVRDIYPTSPLAVMTGPTGNTPYGLAFTGRGDLWIADLGIVGGDAAPDQGSVIRVTFDDAGNPVVPATTVNDGLQFPDGLGVYTVRS